MSEKENNVNLTVVKALFGFLLPLVVIIAVVLSGNDIGIALLLGLFVLVAYGLIIGFKWQFIQDALVEGGKSVLVAVIIMIFVGITIGVWMISGTVPSLLYYGLKLLSPAVFLPVAFILCGLTSLATGTSWGTAGTMGVALMGVAYGMGMPLPLAAGCIVSGAHIGDKLSPLSDTTLLASASTGTDLFDHIISMLYTTVPASIICLVAYTLMGLKYSKSALDLGQIEVITQGLAKSANINLLMLIPAILVITLAVLRLPSLAVFGIGIVVSMLWAIIFQGATPNDVLGVAVNGFSAQTGIADVDSLLSRGGILSMMSTVYVSILAGMFAGLLHKTRILVVLMNQVKRVIHSVGGLITTVTVACLALMLGGGGQYATMTLPGVAFRESFDEFDVHSGVLSRTMEDTGTLVGSIIPWDVSAIFFASALGVPTLKLLPYALLPLLSPVLAVVQGYLGHGVYRKDDKMKFKPFYFRGKQSS
ncbi:MAG: Na+/H+ antiporter NhaC [Candidatus Cloacimonetes bacterium]|nr:Na+/H+ antiporter NhaC [Candidatus Cloacimonadota bacterium]